MSVQVASSGGSEPKLQSKVAYSSFLYSQFIQPDSGYDGLSSVSLQSNSYGYTFFSFKNVTFTYDGSNYYKTPTLNFNNGTQSTGSNYQYAWDNSYLSYIKKLCGIVLFVAFPSSPIKSGILMYPGINCWLYNDSGTGNLTPSGIYTNYPLYDYSYTNLQAIMSVTYKRGQLTDNGIILSFGSSGIYNTWYYNTITASQVEMTLFI